MLYKYIMRTRGICQKYRLRGKQISRAVRRGKFVYLETVVFLKNTPCQHDIIV